MRVLFPGIEEHPVLRDLEVWQVYSFTAQTFLNAANILLFFSLRQISTAKQLAFYVTRGLGKKKTDKLTMC